MLQIKDIYQMDCIKDLKLEDLRLAGNPMCNKYKSKQNDYVRYVMYYSNTLSFIERRKLLRIISINCEVVPL